MPSKLLSSIVVVILLLATFNVDAARQTREEQERHLNYGWSQSASLIFFGTVAAIDYRDDPQLRAPYADIMIRVDSTQRGVPGNSMVRVRIEDELLTYQWKSAQSRIGETGLWFIHRVRQYEGGAPRGYLIRYMDRIEMENEPQYLSELMKYVIQDTVDKLIRPNILNVLTANSETQERATMKIDLQYNDRGYLEDLSIVERSNNLLYNDHVYDTVLQVHRRIRIPGHVKETQIEIAREVL